jgi:hypothetical protein
VEDEAKADLRELPKKIANAAGVAIHDLGIDPYVGEPCRAPLLGARKKSFWNPDYRLVWHPQPAHFRVRVLGARLKGRDSSFYAKVNLRFDK